MGASCADDLTETAREMPAVYADSTMSRLVQQLEAILRQRVASSVEVIPCEPGSPELFEVRCRSWQARDKAMAFVRDLGRTVTRITSETTFAGGEPSARTFSVWVQ